MSRIVDVTPTLRRITLTGAELAEFAVAGGVAAAFQSAGFDDHVKVLVPFEGQTRPPLPVQGPDRLEWGAAGGRPIAKDYTPRRFSGTDLDLEFVLHGHGFASSWVENVALGTPAWIVGPTRSSLWPDGIDAAILIADETALPAVARALDEWPDDRQVPTSVVIEVSSPESIAELPLRAGVTVSWVHGRADWVRAVEELPWPDGEVFVWVAGESGAVRQVRQFVSNERQVPRDLLDATGYWRA